MTNEELDIAKTLAVNVYNDVLSPIAKQAGSTLEEVGKLIFAPIFYPSKILNLRIENWFKRIESEINKENLIEADPAISISTLQNLALHQDESFLGEMFFNILKSSVDKTKQCNLSPAFPKILEQLTTDECIFLVLLNDKTYKVNRNFDLNIKNLATKNVQILLNELPMEKFNFPENLWIYKEHLEHLNLLKYDDYKEPDMSDGDFENNQNITEYAEFRLTEFGKMFCKICVSDKCYSMLNQLENNKTNGRRED
ncbi:MAG: DUF4393 domain-containing protein [Treponema sp.]|uniref:Abi-alpha family protein n=1 Tax=Treponema sp. TaxID=166 RepID=UPI00298E9D3D|nr:Abi-alpha family protein [Treponema sp.]MCQ2601906.1 DUF4393 domain-containing protein [Treponema sp.]